MVIGSGGRFRVSNTGNLIIEIGEEQG